jgi:predicted ABC-type transport system involved in lysophospholipase L1 biosynthesis ATPase subunit
MLALLKDVPIINHPGPGIGLAERSGRADGDPRLLLADEPTGNLDSVTGTEVFDLLFGLYRERGLTLLLATHDPAVAARCERLIEMRDGEIISDRVAGPGDRRRRA